MKKIIKKYSYLSTPNKATIWYSSITITTSIISIIVIPIFTRILSSEDYGNFSIFNSWLSILIIVGGLNLHGGMFNKKMSEGIGNRDNFYSSMVGLNLLFGTIFSILFFSIISFNIIVFPLPVFFLNIILLQMIITSVKNIWFARIRYDYRYITAFIVSILSAIVAPSIGIYLIHFKKIGYSGIIIGNLVVGVIIFFVILFSIILKKKSFFNYKNWIYALSFNLPLIPHYLSGIILNQADRIIIADLVGLREVAFYSVAYSGAMVINGLVNALIQAYTPTLYENIKSKEYSRIRKKYSFVFIFVFSIVLFVILFAPEVIKILAPSDYFEAVFVIPPIASSVFFILLYNVFASIEFYYEKKYFIMISSVIAASANVLLNLWLIPIFGYLIAGFTTLLSYILYAFGHFVFMYFVIKRINNHEIIFNVKLIILLACILVIVSISSFIIYSILIIRITLILFFAFVGALIIKKTKSMIP